jgi:hypothetical protein
MTHLAEWVRYDEMVISGGTPAGATAQGPFADALLADTRPPRPRPPGTITTKL